MHRARSRGRDGAGRVLASLRVVGPPTPSQLEELGALRHLRYLELEAREDSSFAPLASCEALRTLVLLLPAQIPRELVQQLARLPHIERLVVHGYPLSTLEPLDEMTGLRSLALRRPRALMSLTGIAALSSLTRFELSDCEERCDLDPLARSVRLEELALRR